MAVEMYGSFYVSARQYDVGPSSGTPSYYQSRNASLIYDYLYNEVGGWTVNAIAAVLGNMMYESCIDPACVYPKSSFPNGGATLADISNQYALSRTSPAYGLVQWLGLSSVEPIANQIVSYAYRYNKQWYDGYIQLSRLYWEWSNEKKWKNYTVLGRTWTFHDFSSSTLSPENLAYVFLRCYEVTSTDTRPQRESNARYWYDYFAEDEPDPDPPTPPDPGPDPDPPTPTGWITGETFANYAMSYDGQYMPYSEYDCIGFVNKVWQDIAAATGSLPSGTNTLWRSTKTYNTTSPQFGQNPCPVLYYKDTLEHCMLIFDGMPTGCLLFHQISEAGPPSIPDQYAGDGIGNFAHVGIYCGNNRVMQSGGRDSATVPGGGVHMSSFDYRAWNYVAFVVWVDCTGSIYPAPDPGPTPSSNNPFMLYNLGRRKHACHSHLTIQ